PRSWLKTAVESCPGDASPAAPEDSCKPYTHDCVSAMAIPPPIRRKKLRRVITVSAFFSMASDMLCFAYCRKNARIDATAANIALHGLSDFLWCRVRIPAFLCHRGDDHTRRAVTTLKRILILNGLLHWLHRSFVCQSFYGRHFLMLYAGRRRYAGRHGARVYRYAPGSAHAFTASVLASPKVKMDTQCVEQGSVRRNI